MPAFGNYIDCAAGAVKGTGVLGCKIETEIPDGVILTSKTWSFDPETETFNAAYINQKIKEGVFIPLLNCVDFTESSEETQFKTYNTGIKLPVRDGLPELSFTYSNSYSWHSAVYSLKSFSSYNTILGWKNGVLGVAKKADGTWKGIETGYVDVKPFKNGNGSDPAETMIQMQFSNNLEYNRDMILLDDVSNGFSVAEIKGYIDAKLTVPTIPLDAATTVSVKVVAEFNEAVNIKGLVLGDFKVTGRTVTGATYNQTTDLWDLTVDTAFSSADVFTVKLNDGTYDVVESTTGTLYKGESPSYTVA